MSLKTYRQENYRSYKPDPYRAHHGNEIIAEGFPPAGTNMIAFLHKAIQSNRCYMRIKYSSNAHHDF